MISTSFAPLALDNSETLKSYFEYVLGAERSGEEFSVDFDLVWPLAYSRKDDAKRALVRDFYKDEDYQINHLRRNAEMVRPQGGGIQPEAIFLTPKCLEFFIARKVRAVFEIYRQCRIAVTSSHTPLALSPKPELRALQDVLLAFLESEGDYKGTPGALHIHLTRLASAEQFHDPDWPKTAQQFGISLARLEHVLESRGIEISRGKSNGRRLLRIRRQMKQLEM